MRSMEMRVQVLHSGVVRFSVVDHGGGLRRCGSKKLWLEKVVAEQVCPSY